MTEFLVWARYLGAWLLVAGPVYQAVLELQEEDIERDEIVAVKYDVPPPNRVSPWWWLLPPIGYVLHRRRDRAWRRQVIAALTPAQVEAFVHFVDKAAGWLLVAAGGLLLAIGESWELAEHHEWGQAGFWPLVVVAAGAAVGNATYRMRRSATIRGRTAITERS